MQFPKNYNLSWLVSMFSKILEHRKIQLQVNTTSLCLQHVKIRSNRNNKTSRHKWHDRTIRNMAKGYHKHDLAFIFHSLFHHCFYLVHLGKTTTISHIWSPVIVIYNTTWSLWRGDCNLNRNMTLAQLCTL